MQIIKIGALWCSGCLITNKSLNQIKKEYPMIEVIDLDVDLNDEESRKYNYGKTLPVLIFLKQEKEIARLVGELTYEDIKSQIESINENEE